MDTAVLTEIESLRRATVSELRAKFLQVFHEPTVSRHRQHLFRLIAWRLQALAEGDLSERARKRALAIARDADLRRVAPHDFLKLAGQPVQATPSGRSRHRLDSRLPLPGVVLRRQWKGQTILVEVLEDGFRCQDRHFSSLSAIALAITGTRWNGLAFFGLTRPSRRPLKEQPGAQH
jgi:Protein of unknown function (DUF2924)